MFVISQQKLKELKKLTSKFDFDLNNSRFGLGKNDKWFYLENTVGEKDNMAIEMYMITDNGLEKAGRIRYGFGKGFYFSNQTTLYNFDVEESCRGNGLAAYGLAFLTEVTVQRRLDFIDGNYHPQTTGASVERAYNKSGFEVDREDNGVQRIAKHVFSDDIQNILKNTLDYDGIKVYNEHKSLYVSKFRAPDPDQGLSR